LSKEEELRSRIRTLYQQLQVIDADTQSFIDNLGEGGLYRFIDDILDEINERNRELDRIQKSNNDDK
jgi:hypothetical protein